MPSTLTQLECTACHQTYPADEVIKTCPKCGKVLYSRYDLAKAASLMSPDVLAGRPWNLWRYEEILPVRDEANRVTLGEGGTPILAAPRLGAGFGLDRLSIKDEGLNPTGS